MLIVDMC